VLWIAIAAGLAATRRLRARRAALRGLAGLAIASTASNVVGKRLTQRVRPVTAVPRARRLAGGPRTTSFPSGHAASAAAFATGVALEVPALAVPVGAVAAAVGASRVSPGCTSRLTWRPGSRPGPRPGCSRCAGGVARRSAFRPAPSRPVMPFARAPRILRASTVSGKMR